MVGPSIFLAYGAAAPFFERDAVLTIVFVYGLEEASGEERVGGREEAGYSRGGVETVGLWGGGYYGVVD